MGSCHHQRKCNGSSSGHCEEWQHIIRSHGRSTNNLCSSSRRHDSRHIRYTSTAEISIRSHINVWQNVGQSSPLNGILRLHDPLKHPSSTASNQSRNRILNLQPPPILSTDRHPSHQHRSHLPNHHILLLFLVLFTHPHEIHGAQPPTPTFLPTHNLALVRHRPSLLLPLPLLLAHLARVPDTIQQSLRTRYGGSESGDCISLWKFCSVLDA